MTSNNLLSSTLLILFTISTFADAQNWNLIWADEFNTNGSVNQEKWFQQTQLPNGYSWYNNELQHYTDEIENAYVSNGTLKIVAIKENYTDQGHTKPYTSARLNSKFAFTYGKVEVRAKLPTGQGTWPAVVPGTVLKDRAAAGAQRNLQQCKRQGQVIQRVKITARTDLGAQRAVA